MTRCNKLRPLWLTLTPLLLLSGCALLGGKATKTPATESTPAQATPKPASKGDPQLRFNQALTLMQKHQTDQAIAAFKSLSQNFPKYSGPYTNLGILYLQQKQWDQALQAYGQATAAKPKNAAAYIGMGIAYRHKVDYVRAEQAYKKALVIGTNNADAHYDLAVLYDVYLHRPNAALKQYQAYRDSGHDDLIVAAWIKALEQQTGAKPVAATIPPAAASSAAHPPAVEEH